MAGRRTQVLVSMAIAFLLTLSFGGAHLYRALARTEATLVTTQGALIAARETIAQEQRKGREANDRIAALDQDVVRVNADLGTVQAQLSQANDTVNRRNGDVAAMQKCLDGVTSAVVSASTRNTAEAEATLNAAKGDCDRAYAVN